MEIHEKDIILTVWGATLPAVAIPLGFEGGDWLCLFVKRATGELAGEYRFRYHAGPGFDCDDKVSRWSVTLKEDTPAARATFEAAIRQLMSVAALPDLDYPKKEAA